LAREKARLQFIFDSVPMGISLRIVRPDGTSTRMLNDTHLRICGLTREQIDERDAFRALTHPHDYKLQLALDRQLEAQELSRYTLEKRYLRPGGETVWVMFSRERHDYAEGGHEMLTTIVDISELKRAQEQAALERARFKFIFDSVPVGIALVVPGDNETRVVNPAHERISGVAAEELDHVGAFKRATHPDDYAKQRPLLDAFKRGEIDRFVLEKRYIHADGRVVWVELARRMFVDEKTGLKQAITTVVDITERKDAETRLAETHRQLIETSRAAGMAEVATGVLHNVGNVLNSVNVSATLLGDLVRHSPIDRIGKLSELFASQGPALAKFFATDPRAEKIPAFVATLAEHLQREQRECLTEVDSLRKNIEHIKDIVAMQQNYAKVSGVTELISVTELVEDALRMSASALARHNITLVRDFQASGTFLVEKHKVLQILVNLVRNAQHACDESGRADKRVIIRTAVENDRVKIVVLDNGVGIPAQNLTRIFSHGFTTRKEGHGFGLHSGAIAARELGGSLVAGSEGVGQGASFSLELPVGTVAKAA
jgi:PAS domain S-box-containing protein